MLHPSASLAGWCQMGVNFHLITTSWNMFSVSAEWISQPPPVSTRNDIRQRLRWVSNGILRPPPVGTHKVRNKVGLYWRTCWAHHLFTGKSKATTGGRAPSEYEQKKIIYCQLAKIFSSPERWRRRRRWRKGNQSWMKNKKNCSASETAGHVTGKSGTSDYGAPVEVVKAQWECWN